MKYSIGLRLGFFACVASAPAVAQDAGTAAGVQQPATAASAAACTQCIPRLTIIELVIDEEMGSKSSITGTSFALHLNKPIVIDGKEVVPAGRFGRGEVIHAKKAGGTGAAGELVLAARFIEVGERRLPLRSMRIAVAGADAIGKVDAVNAAAAGAAVFVPVPIALLGFAITGKNIVVPKGAHAIAKTAEDFPLELPSAPASRQPPAVSIKQGE